MRDCSRQHLRRIARQHRVGIQREHVLDSLQSRDISDYSRECLGCLIAQESVELSQLSSLPLPTHPHALLRVPETWTMEEIENVRVVCGVLQVQVACALFSRFDYRRITLASFSG